MRARPCALAVAEDNAPLADRRSVSSCGDIEERRHFEPQVKSLGSFFRDSGETVVCYDGDMQISKQRRNAFLIRIWRDSPSMDVDHRAQWRARVQHIQSGSSCYVEDLAALTAFIEQWIGDLSENRPPQSSRLK